MYDICDIYIEVYDNVNIKICILRKFCVDKKKFCMNIFY